MASSDTKSKAMASTAQAKKALAKAREKIERAQLRVLRDKGLYKPKNPRAKPTKYARSLIREYANVLAGRADVLKADKRAVRENKDRYRIKGDRIIVPHDATQAKPYVEKRTGRVLKRMTIAGKKFIISPLDVTDLNNIPDIPLEDSYALPMRYGREISFNTFANAEELRDALMMYSSKDDRPFRDAMKWVQVIHRVKR